MVPADVLLRRQQWTSELTLVQNHFILRHTGSNNTVESTTLHGFCDASEVAFGMAIYLRHQHVDKSISISLVFSKAKVKPLKKRTIPQLELEAAKLLAQLLPHVAEVLQLPLSSVQPWTDSSIILGWLKQPVHRLKTFVANRVAIITKLLPDVHWRHILTASNPADLASRSATASVLIKSDLWWSGPPWLRLPETEWPSCIGVGGDLLRKLPELKATVFMAVTQPVVSSEWSFWSKYSSYTTLIRITAWIRWFLDCCQGKRSKPTDDKLTFSELSDARLFLIVHQQKKSFPEVYSYNKQKKQLPVSHSLAGLVVNIFDNAIRVSGRVRDGATGKPRQMFPLSLKCKLTRILVETEHKKYLHAGEAPLMSVIGHTYFIKGLKAFLKKLSSSCPEC